MPKKILIVDDDLAFRSGLALRLRAHGFTVVFAADGASAVSAARREVPDVILLDLGLPGGDGFVVMDRLRQLMAVASTPIIVISARPIEPNEARVLAAGAHVFIQKPPDNARLLAAINEVLGLSSPEGSGPDSEVRRS